MCRPAFELLEAYLVFMLNYISQTNARGSAFCFVYFPSSVHTTLCIREVSKPQKQNLMHRTWQNKRGNSSAAIT